MEVDLDIFEEIDTSFLSSSDDVTLLNAAHRGDLDKVKKLIEEENRNPYQTGKYGNSLLHYAAAGGRINVLQYLIDQRGCSHSPEGHFKQIPLHIAAQYKRLIPATKISS